jgi:hypothetical protein
MRVSNPRKQKLYWLLLIIWVAICLTSGIASLKAASFFRVADNVATAAMGGGDGSYNRAVACDVDVCYVHGGGTNTTFTGPSNQLFEYDVTTDTWTEISTSPTRPLYSGDTSGFSNGYFVGRSSGTGNSPSTETTYAYHIASDTWQSVTTSPVGWTINGGQVGIPIDDRFYVFQVFSGAIGAYIDITNLAGGWTSVQGPVDFTMAPLNTGCVGGGTMQFDSIVHDPDGAFVVFHGDCVAVYDIDADLWTYSSVDVLPEPNTPVSLAYFDAKNGATFGYWDQPNDQMVMYLLDTTTFAVTSTDNLVDSDMDYGPFDDAIIGPYPRGSFVNVDNETLMLFGSARTNRLTPVGGSANRWFLFNGDPPAEEKTVDTWIPNFLDSLGLNSDMGKLLSGVLFVGTLMFALLNRGVVALMALAVAAMAGTFLVAVMIFDPSILLIMVAIVGLGAMGLIFALFSGAGDSADG